MIKVISRAINRDGKKCVCFECPRTNAIIMLPIEGDGPVWQWCGSDEFPTITPSIYRFKKTKLGVVAADNFKVERGVVYYYKDCPHDLAGDELDMRTTDIPDGFDVRAPHERSIA